MRSVSSLIAAANSFRAAFYFVKRTQLNLSFEMENALDELLITNVIIHFSSVGTDEVLLDDNAERPCRTCEWRSSNCAGVMRIYT